MRNLSSLPPYNKSRPWRVAGTSILLVLILHLLLFNHTSAFTPEALCYIFPDTQARLELISPPTASGTVTQVGNVTAGFTDIEAIEIDPITGLLYAANDGQFVSLSRVDGTPTVIGNFNPGGGADGALGNVDFDDPDGIAYNHITGEWFGVHRTEGDSAADPDTDPDGDLLFSFDPTTGNFIPDAFGAGIDYVVIPPVAGLPDIDDLSFDPATGQLYGIANFEDSSNTNIVVIDITDGSITDLGAIQLSGTSLADVEGLSIDITGRVLVTTGNGSTPASQRNKLYSIDLSADPIVATELISFSTNDHESITCLVGYQNAALGNYVWLDENGDGLQDAGEAGIANVIVNLEDSAGNVFTTTTDAAGGYLFPTLPPRTYTITLSAENFSADGALEDMFQTSNPILGGSDFGNQTLAYSVTLGTGDENLTGDFGFNWNPSSDVTGNTGTAALGDRVWIDVDGDGAQDANEVALPGVEVTLYSDPDGNGVYDTVVITTTTDANGNYIFDGLTPDAYTVAITTPPAGYTQTGDPDHFGTTGTNDNQSAPIVLAPGDLFVNADFGYQPDDGGTADNQIGDTIFFDADADGAFEPNGNDGAAGTSADNEYGIAGVTVALIEDSNGNGVWDAGEPIIATDSTDSNGNYLFDGLPDGDYLVWVNDSNNVLGDLVQTSDPDATLDNLSSVLDLGDGSASAATDLEQDFGYAPAGQDDGDGLIGDTIFLDLNNDSNPDAGEGIEGVVVELYNSSGVLIANTVTDEHGHYYFDNLPAGTYTVIVDTDTLPPGLSNSVDPDDGTASQSSLTIAAGGIDLEQDFGYVGSTPGSIGNQIWLDNDADGLFEGANGPDGTANTDDDEPGIAGVTVELYHDTNGNGQVDPGEPLMGTTTTDANGEYLFENLPTNDGTSDMNYIVNVTDTDGVLAGHWHSTGTSGSDNHSQADPYPVQLTPGSPDNLTADFGYYVEPAALGNYVWYDQDNNGIQDASENGIEGIAVTLQITYPGGITVTLVTLTDADGFYTFGNLLLDENFDGTGTPGTDEPTYTISVAIPDGYTATTPNQGDGLNDSDDHSGVTAQPSQGQTDTSAQANPSSEPTIAGHDFGFSTIGVPLGVELANFSATCVDNQILVEWNTVMETNTIGFHLSRSTTEETASTLLNTSLIPSQAPGSGQGSSYEWLDDEVNEQTTYYYWLIDVDTSGGMTQHDPITVSCNPPTAVSLSTLNAIPTGSTLPSWRLGGIVLMMLAGSIRFIWEHRQK